MKTILVLTDFSKKAKYAAETAIQLADKTDANILLFNAYSSYPFLPSAEFVAWPPEYYTIFKDESNLRIKMEKKRLEALTDHKKKPGKINIKYLTAEGAVDEILPSILKKTNISMILIGGRDKTAGNFLFGNHMNQIISKANCPVMIVSSKNPNLNIKNVVFATNLDPDNIKAVKYLLELSGIFHFQLHLCHVSYSSVFLPYSDENKMISAFTQKITELGFTNISYKNIEGTYIAKEVELFCKKTKADLFVVVQKKHSIFHKLLQESPSNLMIRHQKKPVLIIPEKWE